MIATGSASAQSEAPEIPPRVRALELFRQGSLREAIPALQKSLQKNSSDAEVRLHLAFARSAGFAEEAIIEYRRVTEIQPNSYFAYNNLGVLYDKQGRYDEAIADLTAPAESIPIMPVLKSILQPLGRTMQRFKNARHKFKRRKSRHDKSQGSQASFQVARLHAHYGNREAALQWLIGAPAGLQRPGFSEKRSLFQKLQQRPGF